MTSIACDDWSCDADALEALGLFTVTEDCGDYTLSIECFATSGSCVTPIPGYNVTITATDECGNASDPFMQIIDLYDEVAPIPSITCPADYTTTLDADCTADTSTGAAGMATGSATDNCDADPDVDVTYTDGPSTLHLLRQLQLHADVHGHGRGPLRQRGQHQLRPVDHGQRRDGSRRSGHLRSG